MEHIKFKVVKDYPTIDGMLYRNEIVKIYNSNIIKDKIRVKDSTGKIWFVETKYLKQI